MAGLLNRICHKWTHQHKVIPGLKKKKKVTPMKNQSWHKDLMNFSLGVLERDNFNSNLTRTIFNKC